MEFKIELVPDEDDFPTVAAPLDPDELSEFLSPPGPEELLGALPYQPISVDNVACDNFDPFLFNKEIWSSYIDGSIATVQPGKRYCNSEPACLLILCFVFHPGLRRRFSQAEISCSFETSDNSDPLTIVEHAPRESYGAYSKVDSSWTLGLSVPIKATTPMGGEAGVEPSVSNTTSKTIDHYMVIRGSKRGPRRRQCVWTLEENRANKGGMPLEFHSALILRSRAEFDLNIAVKAEVSSGLFSRKIKSRNPAIKKINPTVLFGKQLQIKESLDDIKLTSWFSGAMDDNIVALKSAMPHP